MAKQIIEGKIDKVFVKDFGEVDQYGNQYMVNINIDGQWYGMGKKKKPSANIKNGSNWHQLAEGDVIEAVCETVERNGKTYYNIKASDVTLKEAGSGGGSNSGYSGAAAPKRAAPVAQANDDRQQAIMRQSAMGYAAQIVAATLTSKSSLDQAAEDVVRIADQFFVPFAEHGLTQDEIHKEEEKLEQSTESNEDFDDDIPFS